MSTAVFGCGYWGKNIIRILNESGDLCALCDPNKRTLESFKDEFNSVHKLTLAEDVWKLPNVTRVVVATPPNTHYSLAKEALEHGKDVFVEKPLALLSSQAKELHHLAVSQKCILMVGHLVNYHPCMNVLCDWVESRALGRLRKVETCRLSMGTFNQEVDVMWDLGVHDASVALRLLKLDGFVLNESSINALHSNTFGNSPADTVIATASFQDTASGKQAMLETHVSWISARKERLCKLIFDRGMVVWDATKASDDTSAVQVYSFKFDNNCCPMASITRSSIGLLDKRLVMPLDEEIRVFIKCCQERTNPITDGKEALEVVRFIELVSGCCNNNKPSPDQSSNITTLESQNVVSSAATSDFFIHPTAVLDKGAVVGPGTKIWHYSHISQNSKIGQNCNIGQNVFVAPEVVLGNYVKVQNNVSVYEGVVCEDDVFLGPSMVFTNDKIPRSAHRRPYLSTYVCRGASIGANATVVCGIRLGEYCMIGAGAVVTKNVPPFALVYGNPAKQNGWVTKDGDIIKSLPVENLLPPFFTLTAEWERIGSQINDATASVLKEGNFIKGPQVEELERQLAEFVGVPSCVAVANGTDALQLALMAIGIGPHDEVIVPAFTFIATAEVVSLLSAKPVFVDILPDTYNMDPVCVKSAISPLTKAIIPVSLFGLVADLGAIADVINQCDREDIVIIEDAAQSFGALRNGVRSCGIADISCTSFFPTKPLGCYGDGGAVFTKNPELARKIRSIANHGNDGKDYSYVGINSRLDTIQAAILLVKLNTFQASLKSRQNVVGIYTKHLSQERFISLPEYFQLDDLNSCVFAQYTVKVDERLGRDKLQAELQKAGIPTRVYYNVPVHKQPVYKGVETNFNCPVTEAAASCVLSLPMFPYMSEAEAMCVVSKVKEVLKSM